MTASDPNQMALGEAMALPKLITISDATKVFGRDERTIRRWIARDLLPCVRIGRSVFICADDIRAIISNRITGRILAGR